MQGELSLPAQERIIRASLAETGQGVYRVYRDILSGTRPDRSDYQQMLADARAGKLTMVAFHKVNRFGRDVAEGLAAVNELRRLGVKVRIADLPTLDIEKPEGMLIFTILLGQGQYEVENLGSEAIKGMREMVLAGGWPFTAPDGYQNCREYLNSHRRRCWVAVDRKRAAIIRLVYRWYARGNSTLESIAHALGRLHEQRIAQGKFGCCSERGQVWRPARLWVILTNPFYAGDCRLIRGGSSLAAWCQHGEQRCHGLTRCGMEANRGAADMWRTHGGAWPVETHDSAHRRARRDRPPRRSLP